MANWYMTSFKTMDKDIVEVIKNGRTIDFYYDENTGRGSCRLAWGLDSFNMFEAADIACRHKSSFYIYSADDLANEEQEWEYKDGVEVLGETRHEVFDYIDNGHVINAVRKSNLPHLDKTKLM